MSRAMYKLRQRLLPYLAAVAMTALLVAARAFIGSSLPGVLFIAPIALAAWMGGLRPGLFSTLLIAAMNLFTAVQRGSVLDGSFNPVPLISTLVIGGGVSWLFESLHAAQRRAAQRQRLLEEEIQQRVRAETAESEQRELLKLADRRKDQFLATLAHELRNPLAPLSNAMQLWPLVENDPSELENLRALMDRQVQQMIRLIDDLLDISRITRGKIELRKQAVELKVILESALEATQPLIEACGHQVSAAMPEEGLLMVDGDVARLVQVVGNLLNNAAKYTGRDGQIWLTAERDGEHALIRVRDSGPGIPEAMLSEVFDLFVQVNSTLDRAHGGLGIGLTLCKSLVDMHGGSIEARSEGPGQGTEFLVRLPAIGERQRAEGGGAQDLSARTPSSLPCHRVLVVDDVPASAWTLSMMLEKLGQNVAAVHDGPSALQSAQSATPDVAFLDIAMPGMDGYELARTLRKQQDFKDLVLVALTGYGQEEDRRQAFEAGFNHHMVKPTSIAALQELLSHVPVVKRPIRLSSSDLPVS